MVLRQSSPRMASEQPAKKKPRRGTEERGSDETDFTHTPNDRPRNDLSSLHLTLSDNINEADVPLSSRHIRFGSSRRSPLRTGEQTNSDRTLVENRVNCNFWPDESYRNGVHPFLTSASIPQSSGVVNIFPSRKQNCPIDSVPNIILSNNFSFPLLDACSLNERSLDQTNVDSFSNEHIQQEHTNHDRHILNTQDDIVPSSSKIDEMDNRICTNNIKICEVFNGEQDFKKIYTDIDGTKCASNVRNASNIPVEAKVGYINAKNSTSTTCYEDELNYNQSSLPHSSIYKPINHHVQNATSDQIFDQTALEQTAVSYDDASFDIFQDYLIKQCLCAITDATLRKPFEGPQVTETNGITRPASLSEWPSKRILEFLSKLQLLFDVYLKQNNRGFICSRIVHVCDQIIRNECNLIEQIISLCDLGDRYVNFLSSKVLSSFLIIAKTNVNREWLQTIFDFLTSDNIDYVRINFALEIIKRVVEWKDTESHILEDSQLSQDGAGTSQQSIDEPTTSTQNVDYANLCATVPYNDADSYDTSAIKGLIIKGLESKWPQLITRMQYLITHNDRVESRTCILTFLTLWESTISVKANLSVIDTKPFYTHLEVFVGLLHSSLPPIIWKQLLSLFNEVLCYGSTLALQDMLPDDTCQLAHLVVRYVKDFRLLDCLPFRRNEGFMVHTFVGTIPASQSNQPNIDRTLLQKMVLLVLKSVAVTIKETRSDSSDSSVGSDDYDFYQDMQLIERSIRDVLKKVDVFIKNSLDFHPETPFSKVLIHLFNDQDDYMIESMVCTLDITIGISYRNAVFPDLISMLNPIHSFVEFLKVVSHGPDLLLDYLVSNETCFLLYLLRFLKYVKRNWSKFLSSCQECSTISRENELDNTMGVLIRLKTQIERLVARDLFPYNISPVLRLLEVCEQLYDGNEFS